MRPEWDLIEPITDTLHFDEEGRVVAVTFDHFPQWIAIAPRFLIDCDRRFARPDEGGVTLIGANGTARYAFREVEQNEYFGTLFLAEREDAPLATAPPNLIRDR